MSAQNLETDFDLPEPIPDNETVQWTGQPDWKSLALRAFHLRIVLIYFLALAIWRAVSAYDAAGLTASLWSVVTFIPIAAVTIGIISLLAWLMARSSAYAITNRRLIIKIGVAVPITLNLPFGQIDGAALRRFSDGTGDIPIRLKSGCRLGYAVLWPHARPWQLRRPQPMLRTLRNVEDVAEILARAVTADDPAIDSHAPAAPAQTQHSATSLAAASQRA